MRWLLGLLALGSGGEVEEAPPPEPALLEFLGAFEDAGGQWLDPLELDGPLPLPGADEDGEPRSGETAHEPQDDADAERAADAAGEPDGGG